LAGVGVLKLAVGDIISDVDNSSTTLTFQPAAGVEIMITMCGGMNLGYVGITDGVSDAVQYTQYNTALITAPNIKVGITNTHYFKNYTNVAGCGYSGIQIK
tara:strand:+ start:215 stop:517 length:303 start_codon:yes stop_codon:yes gene_type:complete